MRLSRNLRNGETIGPKKGRVSSVSTAAADGMDDQNLVPSKSRVSNGCTGGIKQPERDTDKLSEMKMREDTAPHCQMISRYRQ